MGDTAGARQRFGEALSAADEAIAATPGNYRAADVQGLARCGLALLDGPGPVVGSGQVVAAVAAFGSARTITGAPGAVGRVVRLLDALAVEDTTGILNSVRAAAKGTPWP